MEEIETRRPRSEYQRDEEVFSCYAIGSGHSISSDTEENTDLLINLDLYEGAAINRKSLFQNNWLCRVQLSRLEKN